MRALQLSKGYAALVDDSDFPTVSQFKWHAQICGPNVYASRNTPGGTRTKQFLHHFLMPDAPRVDHENGDGLDNRRENLRSATQLQNMRGHRDKSPGKSSQFRGVYWSKQRATWRAQIGIKDRLITLGSFKSEEAAARAYDKAAREYFGEFAAPNFP